MVRQDVTIPQSRIGLPNDLTMNHETPKEVPTPVTATSRGKKRKASIDTVESQDETNHKQASVMVPGNSKIKSIIAMLKPKTSGLIEDLNLVSGIHLNTIEIS